MKLYIEIETTPKYNTNKPNYISF